jgi:hypothetical protein
MKLFKTLLFLTLLQFSAIAEDGQTIPPVNTDVSIDAQSIEQEEKDLGFIKKTGQKIKDNWVHLDARASLSMLDLTVLNGIKIAAEYVYEIFPSYQDGLFSRVDKYVLDTAINAGDFFEDNAPIFVNISREAELIFVRQFNNHADAKKKKPVDPRNLPLTAEKAEELEVGTFVSIPTRLNFVTGAQAIARDAFLKAKVGTTYFISGEFQIQILRLQNKKVRVRLVAVKRGGEGFHGKVELDFDIFKISSLNSALESVLGRELLDLGINMKDKGKLVLLDYIYNLEDDDARKAYNEIVQVRKKLTSHKSLNPFSKEAKKEIEDILISNLDLTEALVAEDSGKDETNQRVNRVFKGEDEFDIKSSKFTFGLEIIRKYKRKKSNSSHLIAITDDNDAEHFYNFTSIYKGKEKISRFLSTDRRVIKSSYVLLKSDSEDKIQDGGFLQFGFSKERREKEYKVGEIQDLKDELYFMLPEKVYSAIDWQIMKSEKEQDYARVNYQVILRGEALNEIRQVSERDMKIQLIKTYRKYQEIHKNFNYDNPELSLNRLLKKLREVLVDGLSEESKEEKLKEFLKLEKNSRFKKLGRSFLISLLNPENLENTLSFTLQWTSDDVKKAPFNFGNQSTEELYSSIEYIQSLIERREFDLKIVNFEGSLEDDQEKK